MSFHGSPQRHPVDKKSATKSFKRDSGKTAAINMRQAPLRGGWRL